MDKKVVVVDTTKEAFTMAFNIIALEHTTFNRKFKCIGYKIIDKELFLASYSDKCEKFPYEYNLQQTIDFAWGWYEVNKQPSDEAPDTDGSVEVAFELSTEDAVIKTSDWGMMCSIKPTWLVYGK